MIWLIYILSAALLAGIADIFIKKLTSSNCETYDLVLFTFVILGVLSIPLLYFRFKNNFFHFKNITKTDYFNLICYSVLYLILTILYFKASKIIDNPGYIRLLYNTNVIITFIFASIIMKEYINFKTIIGIIITMIGLSTVALSKN